eukprot:CAMPEP_0180498532 /NCGR_PEP_ID=MMETSP1036_2-20121128/43387_1 /TAXON_ID=632150 /ORGANISM="Azadinium spinosum, Strain 3D9" /LENGTH=92 /DNA_ID=CAMNT_0022507175 /DNA_START=143 /DNA_END=421 /DNA_ORIENTATION=+
MADSVNQRSTRLAGTPAAPRAGRNASNNAASSCEVLSILSPTLLREFDKSAGSGADADNSSGTNSSVTATSSVAPWYSLMNFSRALASVGDA